ncbi:MAG TPA: RNA-binding transcriptional accessory protein [Lachnospiraceae bacterium]|nr:RNA-binding transcriptional accessory protein [Lachnospiraceae bacterium]
MQIIETIARKLGVKNWQVEAAVKLIDEGNTIPFIARYRKEATGTLTDEQLRDLGESLTYLRSLEERKTKVMESIAEQGKLTEKLKAEIEAAQTLVEVEDLYLPYRPKRRTRAGIAKERGLQGLSDYILAQKKGSDVRGEAQKYVNAEKEVPDVEAAIAGAMDILAEQISDEARFRAWIRGKTWDRGTIVTTEKPQKKAKTDGSDQEKEDKTPAKKKERREVYEMYYDYSEPVRRIPGHRVLAINRGEKEGFLTVKTEAPADDILLYLEKQVTHGTKYPDPDTLPYIKAAVKDSYDRLIAPAIEREIRNQMTEEAEDGAIRVFASNLEQYLMQQPIAGKVVLGWDPAFRTGCKLAVVDPTGRVLDTTVIYPTAPQNKVREAKQVLEKLVKKYGVSVISVGNGTASRESEQVITEFLRELGKPVQYVIVNEAGASVYSASKLATEEFPNFDVGQRSAASIARRLQDPLAELVKIDPKAIGVGQYQHDMNQKKLDGALTGVVEKCVNRVGVDLNTASYSLLSYISGISRTVARNIVSYREENGAFRNRRELLKVAGLGPKAFQQCAGFLRIRGGSQPLDETSVHPESYGAVEQLLKSMGLPMNRESFQTAGRRVTDPAGTAAELGIGEPTLRDILQELEKPARDPREDMPAPVLRSDVLSMEDLTPGLRLKGTVRNIVDFGAFVDIGVHQDGLVHISKMSKKFIKHPLEVVHVGDVVEVTVLGVDAGKKRISLSMVEE